MKKQFIENETENVGNRSPDKEGKPKLGVLPAGTIVYKKCISGDGSNSRQVIVKMITMADGVVPLSERTKFKLMGDWNPAPERRRKCRVPKAYVAAIYEITSSREMKSSKLKTAIPFMVRHRSNGFTYKVGETVKCKEPFCSNKKIICASGIHVYRTWAEAINHY